MEWNETIFYYTFSWLGKEKSQCETEGIPASCCSRSKVDLFFLFIKEEKEKPQ